nr:hypothetical protein [Enterococcus mundtii]
MKIAQKPPHYLVADAGYCSESNYRYLEDELSQHTALIPYGTMFKEQSKKWQTDDRKVMNWVYNPKEDFYIEPKGYDSISMPTINEQMRPALYEILKNTKQKKRMRTKRSFLKP